MKATAILYYTCTTVLQQLLSVDGIDVNIVDHNGCSALSYACQYQNGPALMLLDVEGIDVTINSSYTMRAACKSGCLAVVDRLLAVVGLMP